MLSKVNGTITLPIPPYESALGQGAIPWLGCSVRQSVQLFKEKGTSIRETETEGVLVIGSETPQGVLYGAFHLLRELTMDQGIAQ